MSRAKREIRYGNSMDIDRELYPLNNEIEQTDAEFLTGMDFPLMDCCSMFDKIQKRTDLE